MMHLLYFSQRSQLLDFFLNVPGQKKIITPSPAKADGLRSTLKGLDEFDVVTISKFTSDLLKILHQSPMDIPLKRKSELLLILGFLKERHLPELGFEQFLQAYNLFSDLRSFSLSVEALSSVLEEQSQDVQKAIMLFFSLMEATGNLDEHGAYQFITEQLRSTDERGELRVNYIFWGFQHLNGQQVDLLKALSLRYEVFIPFPIELKDKVKRSDWISWLRDSRTEEILLPLVAKEPKACWIRVNSREVAKTLRDISQLPEQIVLGVSRLNTSCLEHVPSRSATYKIAVNIVESEILVLYDELKNKRDEFSTIEDLISYFTKAKSKNLKLMKAVELYLNALIYLRDQTDEEIKVNSFFIKLLKEVVLLNQPRTSFVPVSSRPLTMALLDMSSLEEIKRGEAVFFCLDERHEEIQSLGQNYTESIQRALSSLGPMKRPELELLFKRWEFHDVLSQCETTVFMSESLLKHSLVWKKMFQGVDLHVTEMLDKSNNSLIIKDHLQLSTIKPFGSSFSASKLQSYLDCPRKFYFQYVEKMFPQVALEKDFDALAVGSISHKIIEEFFKRKVEINDLPVLTKKVMEDFTKDLKVTLSHEKFLKHELVFNHRALNGILFLKRIEDVIGEKINWENEKEFKLSHPFSLNGKIDCVAVTEKIVFLLDFKSTSSSASSNKQVENFESLQLWVYALAAASEIKDLTYKSIVMGYISLDNPSESNLLFSETGLFEQFKQAKVSKVYHFKLPFKQLFEGASQKIDEVKKAIEDDKVFMAKPKKLDVCKFCELNKICVKSEMSIESYT